MRLGYFTMPIHPPERDYAATLAEDREAILLADRLGFAEAYVGEHVTDSAETITDSVVFLASLVHDTERIVLGTGTVNLTNSHPAALAAKVAMLDTLLEGRFILGVSPGGLASDWEIFGNLSGVDRRAKAQECIDHVVALWTGEAPYELSGEHWTLSTAKTLMADLGQGVMVRPHQRPHPPIVVTAAEPSSKSVDNAARRGWEVISANFLLPQWVRTHWEELRKRLPGGLSAGLVVGGAAAGCTKQEAEERAAFYTPRAQGIEGAQRGLAESLESVTLCAELRRHGASAFGKALPK